LEIFSMFYSIFSPCFLSFSPFLLLFALFFYKEVNKMETKKQMKKDEKR
jgi:hypothetical protein